MILNHFDPPTSSKKACLNVACPKQAHSKILCPMSQTTNQEICTMSQTSYQKTPVSTVPMSQIYLDLQRFQKVMSQMSHVPKANNWQIINEFLPFTLDYWRKNAKISIGLPIKESFVRFLCILS